MSKPIVTISKGKYFELQKELNNEFNEEHTSKMLEKLCAVLNFNPHISSYTVEKKEKVTAHRNKLKEHGISTYISSGKKACYEKNRVFCSNYLCQSIGHEKYKGFCVRCFIHLHPNEPVARNYKTKEIRVVDFIKETYPDREITFDKQIDGGCSRYRPDILIDCLTHSVIIEIDENQHDTYDCTCENKRLMTLFTDLGNRPLVMIRFNPDDYENSKGKCIKSCFKYNKLGLSTIRCEKDWNERMTNLKLVLDSHLTTIPSKELTTEHLYYDGFE